MRRRDPQRIHEARRAAHVARLTDRAWTREAAEEAVLAFEAMVQAAGRQRDDPGYWDGVDEWAAERRPASTAPP